MRLAGELLILAAAAILIATSMLHKIYVTAILSGPATPDPHQWANTPFHSALASTPVALVGVALVGASLLRRSKTN